MWPDTVKTVTSWPAAAYLAMVPPTPSISSSGCGAMTRTRSGIDCIASAPRLDDLRHRHGQDEAPAAGLVAPVLLHDRVREVPGQDQDIVRPALVDPLRRPDRHVRAGREEALLERVVVHDEVHHLAAQAEVHHECRRLGRRSIAGDGLTLALERGQESGRLDLHRIQAVVEGAQPGDVLDADLALELDERGRAAVDRVPAPRLLRHDP